MTTDAMPMLPAPAPLGAIAHTILRYVAARPNACDTVDGITEWWIPRQRLNEAKADVLSALKQLRDAGRMETLTGPDGRILYRAVLISGERLDG